MGWCKYYRKCKSTWIFTQNQPSCLKRMVWRKKKKMSSKCQFSVWKYPVDARGQKTLAETHSKATEIQITIPYNQVMQKSFSEQSICQTLKHIGYISRRPHGVVLLNSTCLSLYDHSVHIFTMLIPSKLGSLLLQWVKWLCFESWMCCW